MYNNLFIVTYRDKQYTVEATTNNDLRRKIKKKLGVDRIPADCRISTATVQPASQDAPKESEELMTIRQHVNISKPTKFMEHDLEIKPNEKIMLLGQDNTLENGVYVFKQEGQPLEKL